MTNLPKKLSEEDSLKCDGYVTVEECKKSLNLMGNDKSAGIDGIPVEFYKTFWDDIGVLMVCSFNESYDKKELSDSQRCAILSLIYKKGDKTLYRL